MVLGKLGGPIRPKSFRDDDEDAKRGKMWLGGMAALLVILGLIFGCAATQRPRWPSGSALHSLICPGLRLINAIPSQVP